MKDKTMEDDMKEESVGFTATILITRAQGNWF
ncbi:hypothetical protein lpari_00111 [Legionella parisiensis]|uniref:Uncharacterized protein n=1 Tax=Legionella parisiensis TaxID=45071 RepID=A0A1E5JWG6_9GAMM|nr:hypothetical protein lpari_00111 [Legionella parisiensis]STX75887.1 Uncharacterised protein [Legionella parisiensis]